MHVYIRQYITECLKLKKMTTENSNLATPVESVGCADDVQNVTIELNEAAEQVAEQNVAEQSVVETADFADEDAALDAEQAGL